MPEMRLHLLQNSSPLAQRLSPAGGQTGLQENSNDKCPPWVQQELGLARGKEPSLSRIKQETSETAENLQIFLQILCKFLQIQQSLDKMQVLSDSGAMTLQLLCVPDPCWDCSRTE